MKPFYQDNHIRIFNKDCRSMGELPDGSVQCVVTSPPFWGLRKYSGEQDLIWGGDKNCEHHWGDLILDPLMGAGTTLLMAKNLNRFAVGYELSEEYCTLAMERCRQQVLL